MRKLHQNFPHYDWFNNKGYPNQVHLAALFRYGICNLHRKNYEPIKSLLNPKIPKAEVAGRYKL
jgi:ribonuclease HII